MDKIYCGIQRIYKGLVDILFPFYCIICRKKGSLLCIDCESNIHKINTAYENIYSVYDYRDEVIKKLIWQLKYYRNKNIGLILGEFLYTHTLEEISEMRLFTLGEKIHVIPVPISRTRKEQRGYNQAEIIAEGFCKQNPSAFTLCASLVIKNKDTTPQAKLSNKNKRLKNIRNAFEINDKSKIKNHTFIIIDDVTTTGATINEIRKLLVKHKARNVYAFAIAH